MNFSWIATCIAAFSALIHVYIFILESLWWQKPRTRKIFGLKESDVASTRSLAFNQGFYNLFLSIAVAVGIYKSPEWHILVDYAMASIGSAGLVLICSQPKLKRAAAIQMVPAILYFVFSALN